MNEVMNTQQLPNVPNGINVPMGNINQGTVAVEASRAVAEAQGKLIIAKKFPRDEVAAFNKVAEACQRKGIAEKAFFSYNRGNGIVSGVTIRFAEELARIWGNIDYGIKELSQEVGKSEMQAYAWDMETNTISVQNFTNPHIREVKGTSKALTSQRDIYESNANMGARRLRSRILAILPNDLVEMAIAECKKTLAGNNDVPLIDRVKNMIVAFAKLGVTQEQIETRLKRKIDTMTVDDLTDYIGIYNAIKHGESKAAEWFEAEKEASDLTAALKGGEPNA
ncbi:MAG: hypothetical protein U0K91_11135 [Acutalibacteraceae bacterium]|nr:hypothetical protein [Acutalibacteraceae bacterium]